MDKHFLSNCVSLPKNWCLISFVMQRGRSALTQAPHCERHRMSHLGLEQPFIFAHATAKQAVAHELIFTLGLRHRPGTLSHVCELSWRCNSCVHVQLSRQSDNSIDSLFEASDLCSQNKPMLLFNQFNRLSQRFPAPQQRGGIEKNFALSECSETCPHQHTRNACDLTFPFDQHQLLTVTCIVTCKCWLLCVTAR
jgi:hypothetical protein